MIKVKRALLSVSDKTGLLEFAKGLAALGVELISTGGTARLLQGAGIPVKEVSQYTGFPEILDGRVKTLHPVIHGGLLALRDNKEHIEQLKTHHIELIDMVVVNLYPFEKTILKKNVSLDEALENIDIGGPTMLRAAAKNFRNVAVICNPKRYPEVLSELGQNSGLLPDAVLMSLAIEVFRHTTRYDGVIFDYLNSRRQSGDFASLPKTFNLGFSKTMDLRYGENPHQSAAFYSGPQGHQGLANLRQLHGKELSFNNILDLNAAVNIVKDFKTPVATVVKHNNPTGVAVGENLSQAYKQAWQCDPVSAFGGIIGLNRNVDVPTAELISKSGFMECIIAPGYDRQALKILSQKKNVRIVQLKLADMINDEFDYKRVDGGLLLQKKDVRPTDQTKWKVVTKKKPTAKQMESMVFGWTLIKHVHSNAILLIKGLRTVGIGCGQTSRVESVHVAIAKAGKDTKNSVMISEAFIPKIDNIQLARKAGVTALAQTGGSIADEDVIREADKAGIAMVFTGVRHFKH